MTSKNYSHLAWQCRRGLKELDILFDPFFKQHFDSLANEQKETFAQLLAQEDTDLFEWFLGTDTPEDEKLKELVHVIKKAIKFNP